METKEEIVKSALKVQKEHHLLALARNTCETQRTYIEYLMTLIKNMRDAQKVYIEYKYDESFFEMKRLENEVDSQIQMFNEKLTPA